MLLSQPILGFPNENMKPPLLKNNRVPNIIPESINQSTQIQFNSYDTNIANMQSSNISDFSKAQMVQQVLSASSYQVDFKSRRRFFTQEEDMLLTNAAIQYNEKNWANIAKNVPGRTPRQCRDRWMNYLKPNLKFDPWTKEEDALLASLVSSQGTHWAKMVSHFPGRSTNAIKNRWNWLIKDRISPVLQQVNKKSNSAPKEQLHQPSSQISLNNIDQSKSNKNDNNLSQQFLKHSSRPVQNEIDVKEIKINNSKPNSSSNDNREIIEENIFAIWQEPISITFDPDEINW